jgi:ubiquinol-cytochrome c reductase iron-sulfur subunit
VTVPQRLEPEAGEPARPDPLMQRTIGALLVVAIVAAGALGVVYFRGGQVQAEGILLAIALGAVAIALALWAKHFMPSGPFAEERPVYASSEEERAAFARDFEQGERVLTRRKVLARLLGGAVAAIGIVALFPIRSFGPRPLGALRRTAWRPGSRLVDEDGRPVRSGDLDVGSVLTVFPEHVTDEHKADSQTVLIRLRPGQLRVRPGRESWSPGGFVAFSKVCTHAGCPVGLYEAQSHRLVCPCHQSLFDVLDAARPVYGPATRSLPQLPLRIDADGVLVARSDYTEPIGPAFWSFGK